MSSTRVMVVGGGHPPLEVVMEVVAKEPTPEGTGELSRDNSVSDFKKSMLPIIEESIAHNSSMLKQSYERQSQA